MHIVSKFEGFITVPPIPVQHVVKCPVFFAVPAMKKCIKTCNSANSIHSTQKHSLAQTHKSKLQLHQPSFASSLDLQKFCRRCHSQWCQSEGKYRSQHLTSTPLQQCKARPQNARNMAEQAGNQVQQCYCGKSVPNALMREVMEVRAALGKSSVALSFIGCRKQKKVSMNLKLVLQPPRRTNETGKGLDCQCTHSSCNYFRHHDLCLSQGSAKSHRQMSGNLSQSNGAKVPHPQKHPKSTSKKRGSKSNTVNSCFVGNSNNPHSG